MLACTQGLSYEARLLLWSLIDNNIRILSAFLRSNLEDLSSPRVADPGLWSSILVRSLSPDQALPQQPSCRPGMWSLQLYRCSGLGLRPVAQGERIVMVLHASPVPNDIGS